MISESTAGIIFQILGYFCILLFIRTLYRQKVVKRWPSVNGTVLVSKVETDADLNRFPVIEYSYTIAGVERTNNKVYAFGYVSTSGSQAAFVVKQFPPGKTIAVFYNPHNVTDAILLKSLPVWAPVLQLVAGVVFILMGRSIERWM